MCGIAGIINSSASPEDKRARLAGMMDSLASRGPDAEGAFESENLSVLLGHRRLSVIDIENAEQPMRCPFSGCVLVFNGEIYNYRELRKEIEDADYRFRTNSDTEVLLAAYVVMGRDCLRRIRGIFAFVLYDPTIGEIWMARDPFGVKPLYYTQEGNSFAFASELRALSIYGERDPTIDPKGISQYLISGYTLAPRTLLSGYYQVPHGTELVYSLRKRSIHTRRYFDLADSANERANEDRSQIEVDVIGHMMLRDSVKEQLVSDVPVCTFLSGGTDSSLVSFFANSMTDGSIEAMTMGFRDPDFDESLTARTVASRMEMKQRTFYCNMEEVAEKWKSFAWQTDSPIFDVSFPPMQILCSHASRDYKVALSGDGGDELFLGYETYRADWLRNQLHMVPGAATTFHHLFRSLRPRVGKVSTSYKLGAFARNLRFSPAVAHGRWREIFLSDQLESIVHPCFLEEFRSNSISTEWEKIYDRVPGADPITKLSYLDIETWFANDILVKTDRAAMSSGLELRVPFLDPTLARFAMGLSDRQKFSFVRPKRLLRRMIERVELDRQDNYSKQGFSAPIGALLKDQLFSDAVRELGNDSPIFEFVDQRQVEGLLQKHKSTSIDYGYGIWSLLVLSSWFTRLNRERKINRVRHGSHRHRHDVRRHDHRRHHHGNRRRRRHRRHDVAPEA